ncbi:MAG: sodium:solute symporter family protein [Oscillospiraceae bacterium]|nr:sodium:solute symporter family protein [Oscillospiraceae bacterium]
MDHSQIQLIDLSIIIAYLIGMMLIGVFSVRRIKNSKDYYVAGRSFGPIVMMATVCATIIGGSSMMGRAGLGYTNGIECLMTALPYMIGMFLFSAYAGRIYDVGSRHGISSIPELFEFRFGKGAKIVSAIMIALAMMGTVASQVTATATIVKLLGSQYGISYELGALIATCIFIVYTGAAGLFGVVYTDVVQFFMLTIFVYFMVPVSSIATLGGLGNFLSNIDTSYLIPRVDGRLLGDIISYLVITIAGAEMWQRAFAAKSRKDAKRGMFWGTAVYAVCVSMILVMALAAQQLLPDVKGTYGSTDAVIPALAITTLPAGLTGLALAGILSVMMSTADSYLLVSMQTVVNDIGKTIKPNMSEKQTLFLSRVMSVVLALSALLIALYVKSAYTILTTIYNFYAAAAGIPALAALYWKKATKQGIISAMVGGFAVCAIWKALGSPFGLGATLPGALVCLLLLVTVSLATYQKSPSVMPDTSKTA